VIIPGSQKVKAGDSASLSKVEETLSQKTNKKRRAASGRVLA
jgi:hypothetical protein